MQLDPVHDPVYNLKLICKQAELLEDHLNVPQRRCIDCICKHFIMIEALLEEALQLDVNQQYQAQIVPMLVGISQIFSSWKRHQQHERSAQSIRAFRKPLVKFCHPIGV